MGHCLHQRAADADDALYCRNQRCVCFLDCRWASVHPERCDFGILLNLLFYIIITPVISLTLTRIMYMSENELVVADALARVDSVLDAEPVPENDHPRHPKDASVSLKDVHFSYDGKTDVIKGVSLKIQPGQMVAFVGPSGGGKSTLANLICRFFDVQSGSVRVGGADVRDIPKEELMDTIPLCSRTAACSRAAFWTTSVWVGRRPPKPRCWQH